MMEVNLLFAFVLYFEHMQALKEIYKKLYTYFDKLEDQVRGRLSQSPIVYALCAGVAIVLFWRGVWHTSDMLEQQGSILGVIFSGPVSLFLSIILLLVTGIFVSAFVGDMLVLSGLKKQKKFVDKTEEEIKKETLEIENVEQVIDDLYEEIDVMNNKQTVLETKMDRQTDLLQKLLDK